MRKCFVIASVMVAATMPANAAQLSPWIGNAEQTPFQLDPTTMVAVTFAADPLQTGSKSQFPCLPTTCKQASEAAKSQFEDGGLPQN